MLKKTICFIAVVFITINTLHAGILFTKSNGVTLTGADGVTLTGADGVTLTGADSFYPFLVNGISLTTPDGVTLTGADGVTLTGADGATYIGSNGVTLTGADGVTLTGADGVTLTGADGVTLTGADGTVFQAEFIKVIRPSGITFTEIDGVTLTGADGVTLTGTDGVTLTGADGVTLTGADGVTLTGADNIVGFGPNGVVFSLPYSQGVTLTGADGVTLTGADGIVISGAQGVTLTGMDRESNAPTGIQSIDPDLAIFLNQISDDRGINAVIAFHNLPNDSDIATLQEIGILGGTRYRVIPLIAVTATRQQLIAVSHLPNVRSIYGNRTLTLNSDPFFNNTAIQKIAPDRDLQNHNRGLGISGRNVTVAVLDTGVNSNHADLSGRVVQNVRLVDTQSAPVGFLNPVPVENVANTDLVGGHGTFVSGVIAASGVSSGGKFSGVAPGAKILGLSAGDLNLSQILSGFDYILDKGPNYNVKVVNCSFSANTVFDINDPVNIATKMLTDRGVSVVVSAGNTGSGNGTLNPYAVAPWVISVGAIDHKGRLAGFSSRGTFGNENQNPSLVATGVNVVSLRSAGTETGTIGVGTDATLQRLSPGELPFYTTASGTSFSAPQVAGAIALMLEANPNLNPSQIKVLLQKSATPLPSYFNHEVGAGVLNTYAAVLEAAFPNRKMGLFRSVFGNSKVKFNHSIQHVFDSTADFGIASTNSFVIPENTLQAGVKIFWGMGVNDLGLKLFNSQDDLVGSSNTLNALGILGNTEKILVNRPVAQMYRTEVKHTAGVGTQQRYYGVVETTQVDYSKITDLTAISEPFRSAVKESLRTFIVPTNGSKFNPNYSVTRADLAQSLVSSGRVTQYLAGTPMFSDVRDITTRLSVESVQSNSLFFDSPAGSSFRPNNSVSKLMTAVAFVRAAGLESETSAVTLPANVSDSNIIPVQFRGHVALALLKGFIVLDGNLFNPNRPLKKSELSFGLVNLLQVN